MKEIGLAGWIRVGVSLSGSGDLGVGVGAMSMAETSRVKYLSKIKRKKMGVEVFLLG